METQEAEGERRRRTKEKEGKGGEAEEVKVNEREERNAASTADLLNVLPLPQIRCQPGGLKVVQTTSAMPGG